MLYLDLFLSFLKVGCFSFGGAYTAIPLIRDIVLSKGWIDDETLSYMIAVSESTPGPFMINMATYTGALRGGLLGAVIATFAVALPAFAIILLITGVLAHFTENKYVQAVLNGLKPCVVGIILSIGVVMIFENLFPEALRVDVQVVMLTVILALINWVPRVLFKKKLSPIFLIAASAVLGVCVYGL